MLVADQQGWTEATQRDVLITFLESDTEKQSFGAFLDEQVEQEDDMSTARILNVESAIEALKEDDDFLLYECEIGLSSSEDANTPFESYMVIMASDSPEGATEQARMYCEENIATFRETWFGVCSPASEADINNYL